VELDGRRAQCAKVPADWLPARPKHALARGVEAEQLPAAAAPPNGPMTPGECQPFARNPDTWMRARRGRGLGPAATARINGAAARAVALAIAKAGGTTWGVVWHSVGRWTSQI